MHQLTLRLRRIAAWALLATWSLPVAASDRPYLATNSAAAEEDDAANWSVESWAQRVGTERTLSVAPEYAFNAMTSLQFEFTRANDRTSSETEHELELEVKHLFNPIARDGYGWGLVGSLVLDKPAGASWRRGGLGVVVPFTLSLWGGAGALHLNAGLQKPRDEKREWRVSAAIERKVVEQVTLFAEAARVGDLQLLHGGARWWLVTERFALDLAWQRVRADGTRDSSLVLGVGWYGL